jgi:hypothetical protein
MTFRRAALAFVVRACIDRGAAGFQMVVATAVVFVVNEEVCWHCRAAIDIVDVVAGL